MANKETNFMNANQTAQKAFKILFFNVGYLTGLDGSLREYLLRFYRYFYTPKKVLKNNIEKIKKLLKKEKPDLCCFVEVPKRKISLGQLTNYRYRNIENKYGERSILRFLPFFRNKCNGVFSKKLFRFEKYFFNHGTKKLVYEIQLKKDTFLFVVHFSVKRKDRAKQFRELGKFIHRRKNVIICGDFNTFRREKALKNFVKTHNLSIVNGRSGGTFPGAHPFFNLDLFLCSKKIPVEKVRVLNTVHLSDHLPVVLELRDFN